MTDQKAVQLVKLLRSRELRCRTGILLLSKEWLGQEPNVAARLGIDCLDYAKVLQEAFSYGTAYVNINATSEVNRLDDIATGLASSDCILIYNVDLSLSKLDNDSRNTLWSAVWEKLSNRRVALIIAVPEGAGSLLPDATSLEHWMANGRIARYGSADN